MPPLVQLALTQDIQTTITYIILDSRDAPFDVSNNIILTTCENKVQEVNQQVPTLNNSAMVEKCTFQQGMITLPPDTAF